MAVAPWISTGDETRALNRRAPSAGAHVREATVSKIAVPLGSTIGLAVAVSPVDAGPGALDGLAAPAG
jgi:hypothetical protein